MRPFLPRWPRNPTGMRRLPANAPTILLRAADLYEEHLPELLPTVSAKAGARFPTASPKCARRSTSCAITPHARERSSAQAFRLPGPTGESNELRLQGRGVFVCISPWNFPLAIFTGQIAAALAAGNAVIAKPAEQTPLVAARAVELLLEAGVPAGVLHLLTGDGANVGARAVADPRIAGVAFTGSTETAHAINRSLASRGGPIPGPDRRDRRSECVDRRQLSAAGADRPGRRAVGLQQRRSAMLCAACAVRSGRDCRRAYWNCSPATWTSCRSAIRRRSRRTSAR